METQRKVDETTGDQTRSFYQGLVHSSRLKADFGAQISHTAIELHEAFHSPNQVMLID